jgi:hypothetical protein
MINNITNREVLPGLTTTLLSNWRGKIKEIDILGIKKIAIFPTTLRINQRRELYDLLQKTNLQEIPHVHVRNDMEEWEFELLEKKYKAKFFNTHDSYFERQNFKNHLDKMYLENNYHSIKESNLKKCAGLCIDFSHLEATRRQYPKIFQEVIDQMQRYPIDCCHVSAIKQNRFHPLVLLHGYDCHYLRKMEEIEYVKDYVQYLPKYISLELENLLEEQLKIKAKLEEIIYNVL